MHDFIRGTAVALCLLSLSTHRGEQIVNETSIAVESASENLATEIEAKAPGSEPRIEESQRLYHATTQRPAGFAGPFALLRKKRVAAAPTYFAMRERPSETPDVEATPDALAAPEIDPMAA
jgi:hypothetical protein